MPARSASYHRAAAIFLLNTLLLFLAVNAVAYVVLWTSGALPPARRPGVAVRVYKFGAGYYFSTGERVQFEQLLLAGSVPDVAVFVDGLNDFFQPDGVPALTARLAGFLADPAPPPPHPYLAMLRQLPIGVATTRVRAWATR